MLYNGCIVLLLTNNFIIMIKKSISFIVMVFIVCGTLMTATAQEDKSYSMWEDIMLTPDNTQLKTLQANMAAHNKKYHKKAPFTSQVYNIVSGPNAGNIIWQMGPMMLKHNDSRPGEGGHDEDWRDKVMPYIKKMHTIEYWRQDDDLTNIKALTEGGDYPILYIRYFELEDGHEFTMKSVFKQASETAKSLNLPWGLYYNAFLQGDIGRHVATVNFHKNWASLDNGKNWKEAYEKIYGENTWDDFIDTVNATFSNQWDEIWVYNPMMNGD